MKKMISLFILLFVGTLLGQEEPSPPPSQPDSFYEGFLEEGKKAETRDFGMEFVKMLGVLGLILVALLLLSWLSKRFMHSRLTAMNVDSGVKIVEKRPISTKVNIYILDIYGLGFVITESPQGIVSLGKVPLPQEETETQI